MTEREARAFVDAELAYFASELRKLVAAEVVQDVHKNYPVALAAYWAARDKVARELTAALIAGREEKKNGEKTKDAGS